MTYSNINTIYLLNKLKINCLFCDLFILIFIYYICEIGYEQINLKFNKKENILDINAFLSF